MSWLIIFLKGSNNESEWAESWGLEDVVIVFIIMVPCTIFVRPVRDVVDSISADRTVVDLMDIFFWMYNSLGHLLG